MNDLARTALLGTGRSGLPSDLAAHPTDRLSSAVPTDSVETQVLIRAGVRSIWEQAGRHFETEVEPLSADEVDPRSPGSAQVAAILNEVASDSQANDPTLMIELMHSLAAHERTLPYESLPDALEAQAPALRDAILPVLGTRGVWLAHLDPRWSWAIRGTATDDADPFGGWDEGTIDERCAMLERGRAIDPAAARERLAATLRSERADHRAKLIERLAIGLSIDDEPLLEELLDDRSSAVRERASALLGRLPASRLVGRAIERGAALLVIEPVDGAERLVASPPTETTKELKRDGLPDPFASGSGGRGALLVAMLAQVPPSIWCERFGRSPSDLIERIREDRFADAVLAGWCQGTLRFAERESRCDVWVEPLWRELQRVLGDGRSSRQYRLSESAVELFGRLAPAQRIAELGRLIDEPFRSELPIGPLLALLERPWSSATIERLLRRLIDDLQGARWEGFAVTASWLPITAIATPVSLIPEIIARLSRVELRPNDYRAVNAIRAIERFVTSLDRRLRLVRALTNQNDPMPPSSETSEPN
ncbi:MAG TPA: hypothetical protein DCQ98_00085 [Planctomycetaceae bacterium]|nr:hypothetical protein [Planctomycetaceae bacterium]HRF00993.1 DUF5691 domain-containing protein [Pirellulaceae bacterium]